MCARWCATSSTPTPTPRSSIEQMKQLGIFGLAIPEPYGDVRGVDPVLRAGHRGAGPRLDEPGRRHGRPHGGRQAARSRSAPRSSRSATCPRMATGEIRATMALTEPGGGSDLQAMSTVGPPRRRRLRRQRVQDLDHQRPPVRADRAAVQDRPDGRRRRTPASASCWSRRARASRYLAGSAQARLQGRRELRARRSTTSASPRRAARRRARARASRR